MPMGKSFRFIAVKRTGCWKVRWAGSLFSILITQMEPILTTNHSIVDLLVVGGGSAGIVGSKTAASFGAQVVLVEQDRTGGDCLWTGCVPSKTLLSAAEHAPAASSLTGKPTDFVAVRERIRAAIETIEVVDSPEAIEDAGVKVIKGALTFRAPGLAEVNGQLIRFRQALIATGAAPILTGIPGLAANATVTSETIWDLETLPERLVIVGGGPIACELGQAFARLGSSVTMIVRSQILTKEDADAASLVRASLTNDGVRILENLGITGAVATERGTEISTTDGGTVDADVVLVATGRAPRTEGLGLERLGVELDEGGHVITDSTMMTSNPRIWAAGDVTANPQFTHLAGGHASVAVTNAVLGLKRRISRTVPRVTFTSPEVAAVGLTHADGSRKHRAVTAWHTHVDRAVAEGTVDGFTRLIINKKGKILGGTIVGPRAGESLAEVTLAVQKGLTTSDIAGTTHPYPTYSDGVSNAALIDVRARLEMPSLRMSVAVLLRMRRWRMDRHGADAGASKQPDEA